MKKNFKRQNGITLIALVITIIILIILAGISIASLTNSGLFEQAEKAKQETENAQNLEEQILEGYENEVKKYTGKPITNVDTSITNPEGAIPVGAIVIEGDTTKGIVIKDSN